MAPRWTDALTLALAASLAAAAFDPAQSAHAQRFNRRSNDDAAQSDRNRDDGGNRGVGRRGGWGGRFDRRGGDPPQAEDSGRAAETRTAASDNRSDADRLRSYAKSLVERYDKNGNMMLEASERTEMRGRPAEADLNQDDVITLDELVIHLSPNRAGAAGSSSSSSGGTTSRSDSAASDRRSTTRPERDDQPAQRVYSGSSDAAGKGDAQRKSYRFTPPLERLPASGLPSWFKSRDANGDGQVAMHEFSRSWSDRTAAEFTRHDKDNNGVITPEEAKR